MTAASYDSRIGPCPPSTWPHIANRIIANIEKVIIGKRPQLTLAVAAYFSRRAHPARRRAGRGQDDARAGPGAKRRLHIQAAAVYAGPAAHRRDRRVGLQPEDGEFEFRPGPVFAQTLLADEINRATPRTQAALLEAMAERRVSADGQTYVLKPPFLVIATQNPIDQEGTFPLPEAQLDRFLIRLSLGYPSMEEEGKMLTRMQKGHPIDDLKAVVTAEDVIACQEAIRDIHIDDKVKQYILEIVHASREHEDVLLGGSPRASIALFRTASARGRFRPRLRQHRLGHLLDVVGQDEVAAADRRQRLGRAEQRDRRPRAAAEQHVLVLAAGVDDLEDVPLHLVIDVDLAHRLLAGEHVLGASPPA